MTATPDVTNQPSPTPASTNAAGRSSLIIGIAAIVISTIFFAVQTSLTFTAGYEVLTSVQVISTTVTVIVALTGIGFGIAGALQRRKPQLSAGIGLGICAVLLIETLTSTLMFAAVAVLY